MVMTYREDLLLHVARIAIADVSIALRMIKAFDFKSAYALSLTLDLAASSTES